MRALILSVLLLAACPQPRPPQPPPGAATCETACKRLEQLGCAEAQPTPQGATCVDVCTHVQESGILTLDLECRTRAQSCEETDRCER